MSTEDDPNLIKAHRRQHIPCWVCNKPDSREKTISRRLTPLLRQPDGRRYTEETLRAELEHELDLWEQTKHIQKSCQQEAIEQLLAVIDQLDADAERWREVEIALVEAGATPEGRDALQRLGLGLIEDQVKA